MSFEGEAGAAVAAAGAGRRSEVEHFSTIWSPAMTRGRELPGAAEVPASLQLQESDFEYCVGLHSSQTVQATMLVLCYPQIKYFTDNMLPVNDL